MCTFSMQISNSPPRRSCSRNLGEEIRNAPGGRRAGLPATVSSCCLGSDFKREVTCGRNQSLTVKSVHKLMTSVVGKLWWACYQGKLGGDSKAATLTIAEARAAGAGLVVVAAVVESMTTGWHLGLLTDHRRKRCRRRKERAFQGYLGTNIISPKKKTTSIWFLKILKSNLCPLKVYLNVKVCVFYRQYSICTHTHGSVLSSLGLPQKCGRFP